MANQGSSWTAAHHEVLLGATWILRMPAAGHMAMLSENLDSGTAGIDSNHFTLSCGGPRMPAPRSPVLQEQVLAFWHRGNPPDAMSSPANGAFLAARATASANFVMYGCSDASGSQKQLSVFFTTHRSNLCPQTDMHTTSSSPHTQQSTNMVVQWLDRQAHLVREGGHIEVRMLQRRQHPADNAHGELQQRRWQQ